MVKCKLHNYILYISVIVLINLFFYYIVVPNLIEEYLFLNNALIQRHIIHVKNDKDRELVKFGFIYNKSFHKL